MPTPSRNAIYDATIRRMTASALEETENRFAGEHAGDTEQQLADYLRRCARELGHTPWPREIPGGMTVQARFGSWELAVAKAGLPLPEHPDQPDKFRRVREETRRPEQPVRPGRAFAGWFADESCTKRWDFDNDKVEDSMTLYAKWL